MRILTGNVWTLELGREYAESKETLLGLPGLRFLDSSNRVEGSIDAVAAAALRLNKDVVQHLQPVDYASRTDLRVYQQQGVAWLLATLKIHGGALLADEMGLGKTAQAIVTATELTRGGGRILVICPAYLRTNWVAEIEKWSGDNSIVSLGPKTNKKSKEAWDKAAQARWVITSYDMAERALPTAFKFSAPKMLLMDEAQYLTGRKNKRSNHLESIAALSTYKLAITGTPERDRPRDFYQILRLLFGTRFGSSFDFDMAYCGGAINQHGGLDNKGATRTDELAQRLSWYMLRRLKKDVAQDLPELQRNVVWVDAEAQATQAFHNAMSSQHKDATYRALESTLLAKMPIACELAKAAKRFLMFTWLKDHAYQMWRVLNEEMETPCDLVTGDIAADKRRSIIDAAASAGRGVIATLGSVGVGINAQGLGTCGIFHAIDFVPTNMGQAEARLHRLGQRAVVTWTYIAMKESMDELVVRKIVEKLNQHVAVVGDGHEMRNAFDDSTSPDVEEAALKELYESLGD